MKSILLPVLALALGAAEDLQAQTPKPTASGSEGWTSLLTGVDVKRDSFFNTWRVEEGALKTPANPDRHETIALLSEKAPDNYDLRLRVRRDRKGFGIRFFFVQGEGGGLVLCDGSPKGDLRISSIGEGAATERGDRKWFEPGEIHEVLLKVREAGVAVLFDEKEVLRAEGRAVAGGQKDQGANPPRIGKPPFIGISHCGGQIAILAADIRPMTRTGQPLAARPPDELTAMMDKRTTDLSTLKAQRDAAVDRLRKAYAAELDAAQKKAAATGDLKAAAAIYTEHKVVDEGLIMPTEHPPGLPSLLKVPRRTYVDGFAKVSADAAQREQRVQTDYLRFLVALQGKAPAGSDMAKKIEAEKEAVLASSTSATTASANTPAGTNKLVNGNFTDADGSGFPKGWVYNDKAFVDPRNGNGKLPAGVVFKVAEENKESRVDATFENAEGYLAQLVEIPSRAREIVFQVRVRGKQTGGKGSIDVGFRCFSAGKEFIVTQKSLKPVGKTSTAAWTIVETTDRVPEGARFASILLGAKGKVTGSFQFKQAEVRFR